MLISNRDVNSYLSNVRNNILIKCGDNLSSFKYNRSYVGGFCRSYDPPFDIVVGVELLEKSKLHGFYQFSDFVNVIELAYHESGHVFQKLDFHKSPDQVDNDVLF